MIALAMANNEKNVPLELAAVKSEASVFKAEKAIPPKNHDNDVIGISNATEFTQPISQVKGKHATPA